ncbi:hypothetical protein E2C01_006294 [Portunus trituberculatus]|uniref:CCHC-type domain-containing protein n=1 Tax=Portunus trituberculatus TaxID=210409 RepID=A0A5B7CYX7_PORTR|nr:hypothetical protein [Portunus trituberculatus]
MEFEAFLYTPAAAVTPHHRFATQKPLRRHLPVRCTQIQQGRRRRTSSGEFSGFCWKCGQRGHRRSDCRSERRTRSPEDVRACSPIKACCENCGRWGHRRGTYSQLKDVMMLGKRKQAGRSGHCPAKSSPCPVCVKCRSDATTLEGRVSGAVDGRPCPLVVDSRAAKTFVREEVMAVQNLPASDRQLRGVTGHCTTLQGPVMSTITEVRRYSGPGQSGAIQPQPQEGVCGGVVDGFTT